MDPREATWVDAWTAALDELELDVAEAERMLTLDHLVGAADAPDTPTDPWAPPAGLPPLPASLAERARALLQRQVEVAERIARAAAQNRRHDKVVEAMRAKPPTPPVYVDTPA